MRRRLAIVLAGLAAILIGGYLFLYLTTPPQFSFANYLQINTGMTRAEVEAALGCRPGNYAAADMQEAISRRASKNRGTHAWHCDTCSIFIRFDEKGQVETFDYSETGSRSNKSILDRLRDWLGIN